MLKLNLVLLKAEYLMLFDSRSSQIRGIRGKAATMGMNILSHPEEMQESIFRQGITSKKEEGHGMGLYIVSQVLKTYRGVITLESTEEETVFTITFPKKEGEKAWKDG